MKVAVTGASGFLGRYVLRELRARDVDIVEVRRSPAHDANTHARTTVVKRALENATDAFAAMGHPDLLIHLAWEGLPAYQSQRHVDVELPAQFEFLSSCVSGGLKRLTVAGTCFEYGLQEGMIDEAMATLPATEYGKAKHELYMALASLASEGKVELDWARLFYLYGPGQASGSLYSQLMTAIDEGKPFFDMSGGEQLRDFLPVSEAARLLVDVALAPGGAGAVNICSGQPVSVSALVDQWISERSAHVALNKGHHPYPAFEPMAFWGSRAKLDAILAGDSAPPSPN